ncbi:NADH-quinone oxidoreductase subunit M [Candidatus Entotheonellaceae bacterium PAL068K]
MSFPLLTTLLFLPLAGAVVLLGFPHQRQTAIRGCGLVVMLLTFAVSLVLYLLFDPELPQMQFSQRAVWIPSLDIYYHVGIDGISLPLVLLTTFLSPIALLGAWDSIQTKVKEFTIFMLLLETGMVGVFLALDFFLFYIFWEVMLIPMYFLIGVWGGKRRVYATVKFILYTMAGSAVMLVAILVLVLKGQHSSGQLSFYLFDFYGLPMSIGLQKILFGAFFLSFAIKVPLFPFHTWLPDAHVEAPTAGSVILAGVLLKMGTYGFIRFCLPLFPQAAAYYAPWISVLAVIGIIYGALVAMVQPDAKKLVAYASISHLGFVVLGIFSGTMAGLQGSIIQMVNHGLSTGALFLLVGMIYDRRHTRLIADYGGLWHQVPLFAVFFLVVMFSSIGLPGLNGFVGEFLILLGTFETSQTFAVLAALGVILGAVYMLWLYQRLMFGDVTQAENRVLTDLSAREVTLMVPIIVLMFWIGVYPNTFLRKMDASSAHLLEQIRVKSEQAACGVRRTACAGQRAEAAVLRAAPALRGGQTP